MRSLRRFWRRLKSRELEQRVKGFEKEARDVLRQEEVQIKSPVDFAEKVLNINPFPYQVKLLESIAQMEKPIRRLTVQFSVKDVETDEIQRGFIMDDFESFARRYGKTLESGTLFVYMKTHGTNYKGDQLVHCRLQLRTVKESFFSSSEGFGVEQTFHLALDRLESQVLSSKEPQYDRESARSYLRRLRFPLTEL